MGDDQNAATGAGPALEQVEHAPFGPSVQLAGGLVGEERIGVVGQGDGKPRTGQFAACQLMRQGVGPAAQAHPVEQGGDIGRSATAPSGSRLGKTDVLP